MPVPDPTVTDTAPPLPADDDAPEAMLMLPALPDLEAPVLIVIMPLVPAVPALDVCNIKSPLKEPVVAAPVDTVTEPPVVDAIDPADNTN